MNIALWVITGILAAMYLMAGLMKTFTPKDKLINTLPWTEQYAAGTVRLIGIAEVLGAIGLVLPWATDIAPSLTPIAATGLVIIQILAVRVHIHRQEQKALPFNTVLLILALLVAVARFIQLGAMA